MDEVIEEVYSRMPDAEEDSEFGCLFPGSCCMAGDHFFSECHTAEMLEQIYSEMVNLS